MKRLQITTLLVLVAVLLAATAPVSLAAGSTYIGNMRASANPSTIKMTQSTTYTTSFQVLGDARILFRPDKWPNAYSWNGGRYTVKYTINVREDVRLGFDKSILDPFPYTRIATVVPDSSHPPYQYWVRIQLEDGRTVVPNTVDEARSLMFDVNKSYKVNGATLGTGTHKLFSRVEAQWSGYLFSGSDKKDKDAPRVTVTVTK